MPEDPAAANGLERFLTAQEPVFAQVVQELRSGRKTSHWIWFIFPQFRGLGRSPTAEYFGIRCFDEARAYAAHPALGARLKLTTRLVNAIDGRSIREILGSPDDTKFHSCMTLFARAALDLGDDAEPFVEALDKYFDGTLDPLTAARLPP
jgi:uncharacterized protein (DUF1810 family)